MEKEGMFKELVENSNDIIIVTDKDFTIRYISSAVTKVFGAEPVILLGRNIFEFVNQDKIDRWKQCLQENKNSILTEEIGLQIKKKEVLYFDIQISNLLNHCNVQGLVLKLHDITDKKQKEQELIRSNQQLDQVIYKTTHDLKAPLMSALGLVNLAQRAPADEQGQYVEMIKKSLLNLNSLIEEMNNFFRNEKLALHRDKINIEEVLKSELGSLTNLYQESKINIQLEIGRAVDFYSDSIRVKTILTNILSNAIKYSDPKKGAPFIQIEVNVNEEFCEIRIEDNGIGIEPEYQAKIFDLFFRATSHSHGTGLGLFIVKDTIERLKGSIEVTSTPGQGTAFLIKIPNQISQPIEVD
ncbi:MAG: PAS domain-containing sensor histidine kinase [Bacteroidota bacterium]